MRHQAVSGRPKPQSIEGRIHPALQAIGGSGVGKSPVRVSHRVLSIIAGLVLTMVLTTIACTSAKPTPTPIPTLAATPAPSPDSAPSRLKGALARVPIQFADSLVLFADYDTSRRVTGLENIRSFEDMANLDSEKVERLYEGVPRHNLFRSFTARLKELTNLDIIAFDLGIWSWQPGFNSPTFLLMQGPLARGKVIDKLLGLGYKKEEYQGAAYYWLYEGLKIDINHPLRHYGWPINRMSFADDWLLAGPTTDIVKMLIDAEQRVAPTLLDSRPHVALANAIGEGLLGGAFMTPQWIVANWNKVNPGPITRLDRYLEGSNRWSALSTYTVALLGYRVQGKTEETVMALYYPDPAAAAKDAPELEKRWNSLYHDPVGDRKTETLATRSCSPFSTAVIGQADSSVLVGTCAVIRNSERDVTVKGPSLWLWLFRTRELQFLAQNLEELKRGSE